MATEKIKTPGRSEYEAIMSQYFIPSQTRLIMMAYRFSKYGHRGQAKESGERYFEHPKEVSLTLIEQGVFDHEVIITALLHDVMEDSFILAWEDLEYIFGNRICALVKLVTKEPSLPKEQYFPRLLSGEPAAWLVKLADRLHNLSTLEACTVQKQQKQVKETQELYLPLCDRLANYPNYAKNSLWFKQRFEEITQQYSSS